MSRRVGWADPGDVEGAVAPQGRADRSCVASGARRQARTGWAGRSGWMLSTGVMVWRGSAVAGGARRSDGDRCGYGIVMCPQGCGAEDAARSPLGRSRLDRVSLPEVAATVVAQGS